ncbi:cobalt-precorrin 5A acetaldehyde-lyase [Melghirimyces profundicolus]|uniref:Cobalt-precorrin 5A acetaldehyde-lyase n=1 Tax=Melghirimyces profundicolus TaxID=1242148 RepID=A0A2T6C8C1_9BACL|nr:cobalamin biosynthesis protein [Melghirimyces profundicolus]PTX64570.1 cobalt-precorrin 5A acetaldehyde-lyase [Melghirimyces profundicolus]
MNRTVQEARDGEGIALLAVTRRGCRQLDRLRRAWPRADAFVPSKFAGETRQAMEDGAGRLIPYQGPLRSWLKSTFHRYRGWVMWVAVGAAVRTLAPLLRGKKEDPAVVAVDEGSRHAVSLLSAHRGGANRLTREVSHLLGARPVITTASEVQETLAVDELDRDRGWVPGDDTGMTRLSAAVINGETIGVVQESGEEDWLPEEEAQSGRWLRFSSFREALSAPERAEAWLVITHRLPTGEERRLCSKGAVYHPRSLCLGIGCSRGTSADELESLIRDVMSRYRLAFDSIRSLSSITLKSDEPGLLELAERHGWPLHFYEAGALNRLPIPQPSDVVYRVTGSRGVSQPAALLSAGTDRLLVEKEKSRNATLSIAVYGGGAEINTRSGGMDHEDDVADRTRQPGPGGV